MREKFKWNGTFFPCRRSRSYSRDVTKAATESFRPQNRVTDLQVKVKLLHQTELPAVLSSILEKDENLEVLELMEAHSTGFSGDGS